MHRYTVNFICTDNGGVSVVRSEEFLGDKVDEVVEIVKRKWAIWQPIRILWAGVRHTDGEI